MSSAALQEELCKLTRELRILKSVLASVVSKDNEHFKPDELSVEVGNNAVVVQGEKDGDGSTNGGFNCLQFKWKFPINEQEIKQELNKTTTASGSVHEPPNNRQLSNNYNIFLQSDSGEKRKLDVQSTDTIKKVKTRIQEKYGFEMDKQVLRFLGSGALEDGKTVSDYAIGNNSELFLIMMTQTTIQICIKMIIGTSLEMQVESTKSLRDLKSMIEKSKGIPVDRQRLVFAGKQLDNSTTLEYNNIENGATVHLL